MIGIRALHAVLLAAAALLGEVGSGAWAAETPSPPVETFYRFPDIARARLSPSGKKLAVTAHAGQLRLGLSVVDLEAPGHPAVQVARYTNTDIYDFHWVNDDLLVFETDDIGEGARNRKIGLRLYSVSADGKESPHRLAKNYLLGVPSQGGRTIVVGDAVRNGRGNLVEVIPLRLDVVSGELKSLGYGMPDNVKSWWFDGRGEPRLGSAEADGEIRIHWRAPGEKAWKEIARFKSLDKKFEPRFLDATGQLFVTTETGPSGEAELKRFDFTTGAPEAQPVVRTPGFDFSGWLESDDSTGKALGIHLTTDAATTVWFDPRMKQVQSAVDARLPGRVNRLTCQRCGSDDLTVHVFSWSDQDPGQHWIYRPSKQEWIGVARVRADIDPRQMATLDFHRVRARDGLEMPVWVTRPTGPARATALPAVVLVHGGPWVRGGHWNWDADAQFLASRGYVVIEPEFRGSTGYGQKLFRAGWKQWGLAMQDDLVDAVRWASAKGWIDASRVCIAGASYGGYATLMGLVRHPDVFRCGAAWLAVTDPRLLYGLDWTNNIPDEVLKHQMPKLLGDPKDDAVMLADTAPVEQAARIKAPVLLAYGGVDRRVPVEHGHRIREALQKAGNDPEWLLYPDEGHGWATPQVRFDFARKLDQFLARHLK